VRNTESSVQSEPEEVGPGRRSGAAAAAGHLVAAALQLGVPVVDQGAINIHRSGTGTGEKAQFREKNPDTTEFDQLFQ